MSHLKEVKMRIEKDVLCLVKVKLEGKEVWLNLVDLMDLYYRKTGIIKEVEVKND